MIARDAALAHQRVLAAIHEHDLARDEHDRAAAALAVLVGERQAAERARDLAGQSLAAARAAVLAIVPAALHPRLEAPGPALVAELAAAVEAWRAAEAAADAATRARVEHRAAAAAIAAGDADVRHAADEAGAAAARATAALAELCAERAPLLDGAATAERAAALEAAVAEADAAATFAERDAGAAATAHAAAVATSVAAAEAAHQAEQLARTAAAAVAAGLAQLGLDEDAAEAALAIAPAALAAGRAHLAELDRAVVAARARLAELDAQAAALAAAAPAVLAALPPTAPALASPAAAPASPATASPAALGPDAPASLSPASPTLPPLELDDDAAWQAAADAATADAATAADRLAELTARRRADDDAGVRHRAASLARARFEARAEPFEQLDALIGSADGKGLRDFAQSLTLEALLAAANQHLDELAPRYQLERVPARDLELQVIDREMGDEVRSLASLSGGETFLASLALALGLSSLSAGGTTVRTLLVDEGFGTLDPHTLDVALAALDALRATGRQVGIVSHVPGLEERVGATVEVRPVGGGRSIVAIHGPR